MTTPSQLAAARRAILVAPAGYGKTEILVGAVAERKGGRELILTHTNAGVAALSKRLQRRRVAASDYRLCTIAGWAQQLVEAYPEASGLQEPLGDAGLWQSIYAAATQLAASPVFQRVFKASYTGLYVDEYQDCTRSQHELILALAEALPTRVLGDPLQGIFDFEDDAAPWTEVRGAFDELPPLDTPWRWRPSNPALGNWLHHLRHLLESGQSIPLQGAPINVVRLGNGQDEHQLMRRACNSALFNNQSAAVIMSVENQMVSLGRGLGGRYSVLETREMPMLAEAARAIDRASGGARAIALIDFVADCKTNIRSKLGAARSAFENGKTYRPKTNLEEIGALSRLAESQSLVPVLGALRSLKAMDGDVYRPEPLREMERALRRACSDDAGSLEEAVRLVRAETRRMGRPMERRVIGNPHRLKGLEFDHAVVMAPNTLNLKSLYVALTRGSRSLTVVTDAEVLQPKAVPRRPATQQMSLW